MFAGRAARPAGEIVESGSLPGTAIGEKWTSAGVRNGDVVTLKSGGHPLTVVEVNADNVACLWMGGEGDLFRETLPLAVLELVEAEEEDDEDEDEDEAEDDEEEDEDEDEPKKKKRA